jgi:hypothetical protein
MINPLHGPPPINDHPPPPHPTPPHPTPPLIPPTREYRVLLGHPRLADVFVDTSRIGTDALFERCTHFAPLDAPAASRL